MSETISGLTQSILEEVPVGPDEPSIFGDFSSFLSAIPETISASTQSALGAIGEEPEWPLEPSAFEDFSSFLGSALGDFSSFLGSAEVQSRLNAIDDWFA